MKLSKANVANLKLPTGKPELLVFDDDLPGFGIRLRAGGKRTWIAQYRCAGRQRRLTLGTVETIDAQEARKRAKKAIANVQLGQDPQAVKIAARAPRPPELTLGEAIERYLPIAQKKLKAGTFSGVTLHLRRHWKSLHSVELRNLERRHIAVELSRIAESSGSYGANRSRAALSAFFSWAIGEDIASGNPVVGTNKAIEEQARDRVLSNAELACIWNCAGEGDYANILRLLILTGQRREEVGGMLWPEVDLKSKVWSIGAARTKNGLPHDVPLSDPDISILSKMLRHEDRDYVFGFGSGPFQGWSNAKARLDKRIKEAFGKSAKFQPWRVHDIRRTVATRLVDQGTQPHIIEAILNHISGHKAGVAGVYNRSVYAVEKRVALNHWATRVAKIVEGTDHPSNVQTFADRLPRSQASRKRAL